MATNNNQIVSEASKNNNTVKTVMRTYKMHPEHLTLIDKNAKYFKDWNKTEFIRFCLELGDKEIKKLVKAKEIAILPQPKK